MGSWVCSWLLDPGCEILAIDSWLWDPGCEVLDVAPGCDILAVSSWLWAWLWVPGNGILAVGALVSSWLSDHGCGIAKRLQAPKTLKNLRLSLIFGWLTARRW